MALTESVRRQISDVVQKNPVVLFMKGTRHAPQCGFSAQVVQILDQLVPDYETVDVLRSPELRDGIKEFSEWPTIPQLFVHGKFVGGCDIVRDLHAANELQGMIGAEPAAPIEPPSISISAGARQELESALADPSGGLLHLSIDSRFEHDLFVGPREAGDIEVQAEGLTLLLDAPSARRANGLSIEFIEGAHGGFKLTNPNAPPKVKPLTAPELKARLDRGEIELFDVRPDAERAIASIAQARSLDAAGQAHLFALDRNAAIAFHCHHGVRSQGAAEQLLGEGFRNVYNLTGGIAAWSELVDPTVPRY